MKIAAIDVGSNSIHLLISNIRPDHSYETVYKDKAMVRLGSQVFARGGLTESSQKRALVVLTRYARVIKSFDVDHVVGVATSAVREATNGAGFMRMVRRKTGLKIERISGAEEARLIAVAVAGVPPFDRGKSLVVDIGGGSTELAFLENQEPSQIESFKMGAVRLSEAVRLKDRPGRKSLKRLRRTALDQMASMHRRLINHTFEYVVGTSGSIVCLGMLASRRAGRSPPRGETFAVSRTELNKELNYLASLSLEERRDYMGDQSPRADIILPGGAILMGIFGELPNEEIHVPDRSIRDGMIVDFIRQRLETTADDHIVNLARMAGGRVDDPYDPHTVRERNIVSFARRYYYDQEHAHQVMRLAAQIFDGTQELHGYGAEEKFYLEAAALLHDIGQYIAYNQHHKHSLYLILNGNLSGFSEREIQIVGNIARYHRKGGPRRNHVDYSALALEDRRIVDRMSALLRIADGLDFGHLSSVERVRVEVKKRRLLINITCRQECRAETDRALRKSDLFSEVYDRRVVFQSRKTRRTTARAAAGR